MNNTEDIELVTSQRNAFDDIVEFLNSRTDRVFILKGYAGTGKTTMMRFLVDYLLEHKIGYHLLASTGRAATILDKATGAHGSTSTIHSLIYKYNGLNQDFGKIDVQSDDVGQLFLVFSPAKVNDEKDEQHVYIIDEASMISDVPEHNITQAAFGTGRLLKELLDYDTRTKCKYIFVGDPCQLPPVNQLTSPALSPDYIHDTFSLGVCSAELTEIIRQKDGNTITDVSQCFRRCYRTAPLDDSVYYGRRNWCKLGLRESRNVRFHPSRADLISQYTELVKQQGYDYSTLVCQSNRTCYQTATEVRSALGFSGPVAPNDLLLVVQNNLNAALYNGDLIQVKAVGGSRQKRAGLTFLPVVVEDIATHTQRRALLLEDLLYTGQLNLTSEQQTRLFVDFVMRMKDQGIKQNMAQAFNNKMLTDDYLNALRCSFGYAITCHKAQGGEWSEVFIDLPRNIMLNPTKGKYQWLYTAFTRAKNKVHLVNDPLYI